MFQNLLREVFAAGPAVLDRLEQRKSELAMGITAVEARMQETAATLQRHDERFKACVGASDYLNAMNLAQQCEELKTQLQNQKAESDRLAAAFDVGIEQYCHEELQQLVRRVTAQLEVPRRQQPQQENAGIPNHATQQAAPRLTPDHGPPAPLDADADMGDVSMPEYAQESVSDGPDDDGEDREHEDITCVKCGLPDNPKDMMVCDATHRGIRCDAGYHASCYEPRLHVFPEPHPFICPGCGIVFKRTDDGSGVGGVIATTVNRGREVLLTGHGDESGTGPSFEALLKAGGIVEMTDPEAVDYFRRGLEPRCWASRRQVARLFQKEKGFSPRISYCLFPLFYFYPKNGARVFDGEVDNVVEKGRVFIRYRESGRTLKVDAFVS